MKLKIEIAPDAEDELILRCRERSERIAELERTLGELLKNDGTLALSIGNTEYYLAPAEILFVETDGGHVSAHTVAGMYRSEKKLYELEALLPRAFLRVSKSCILNAERVESIARNLTGASEVRFRGSSKRVYVSRAYYKLLKDRINELRSVK